MSDFRPLWGGGTPLTEKIRLGVFDSLPNRVDITRVSNLIESESDTTCSKL